MDVRLAEPLARRAQKKGGEMRDLFAALAQRRHVDANDGQPVIQIFAKSSFGDALLEVRVGRREDADVDALRLGLADRHDLGLLEKSQQPRLDVERQIADLVEKE